ncbi:MAG: ExeM/NucH family extracellular endonuclease [Anaerolineaceae bacterium]
MIANQGDPANNTAGGVAEFDGITNPVVALQGSGTADAPYLLIHLNTTGLQEIDVSYLVRDIDTATDNAVQQVALHYRVGSTGDFTNVPTAYIADASAGPSLTLETPVSITLPANANNQALVQLRIMTTNATGSDEWVGIDDIVISGDVLTGDTAPTVASTMPTNNGTAQKTDDIVITFSELVTVMDGWYSISCGTSGIHTAVVTDEDPVYTLNPDTDFTAAETCTVTIDHTKVNDDDLDDATADYMVADYVFSFSIPESSGDPYTPIYNIQGSGASSPLVSTTVSTEGIVVGDFQVGGKAGYYIQEPNADADSLTSNGIFVYNTSVPVNVGDSVRVKGLITEWATGTGGTMTEITPTSPAASNVTICSTGNTIAPTTVTLPVTAVSDYEKYESMLVTFPQSLVISEYFNYDRYGEIVLTSTRHMTPTAIVEPGAPAQAEATAYLLDRITLDDGRTTQNPDPAIHPNGLTFDMSNLFRGGATVTNVTGILDFYQSLYRVQPTTGAIYADVNPRPVTPEITEGDLKVASFNVLNYFVTLDDGVNDICGPDGIQECRGADTAEEFTRQKAKILAALTAIDAEIFGLMEIENDSPIALNNAVADLVAGLNAIVGADTYDYIVTGAIGGDAIKQAILYKPASVTPIGAYQLLTSAVDSRFIDTANRPVLAQTFSDNLTGVDFVVAVNHLKSKGSACVGDPDLGDGASNCNLTRKAAAEAMVDWLANPTYFSGIEKALIIGDLNSYDKEDPIDMIKLGADDTAGTADDYLDMIFEKRGDLAYGYVFDGQTGYLDHALASLKLSTDIVDVNFWHINADESDLIDYNTDFKLPAQDALYAPDSYRSSDHDPVLISLSLNDAPVAVADSYTTVEDTELAVVPAAGVLANDTDFEALTVVLVDNVSNGTLTLNADGSFTYTPAADFNGEESFTYKAFDGEFYSEVVTVTITVTPIKDDPMAVDDFYETNQDTFLEVLATDGVLKNDNDFDLNNMTVALKSGVSNGVLSLLGDGSFTYMPNPGFFGTDTFVYMLITYPTDNGITAGWTDEAIVTITVTEVVPPVFSIYLPMIIR